MKAAGEKKKEEAEYQKKIKLIAEAKAEYKKLNPPKASVGFDLEDPNLDFGKAIESAIAGLEN